ncbi:prepilin-type N-terminal cleavage/methylation domain-containing protein [Acinetobacter johnsonii]|jgi:type IV pilus assembly protein PilE|uniref:type IV pilin protein n=1 Tax=Acinetobacter johnsonii TaxID=40214 RepID=UPI0032B318E9
MRKRSGFTLIELMIVLVVIAVFAAIAVPSYQAYIQKKDLALAKQEALKMASELERFKNKNFSYKGFDATYLYPSYDDATGELYLPVGGDESEAKYKLTVVDLAQKKSLSDTSTAVRGLNWAVAVERVKQGTEPKQPRNYDLLLTSTGIRCMTKVKDTVTTYSDCGGSSESW